MEEGGEEKSENEKKKNEKEESSREVHWGILLVKRKTKENVK